MLHASKVNTAVIYLDYGSKASYYNDWLDAFSKCADMRTTTYNAYKRFDRIRLARQIKSYELIVLLHSVTADSLYYAHLCAPMLEARQGCLLAFVGNEFNYPGNYLSDKIAFLGRCGVNIVTTQLLLEAGEYLYSDVCRHVVSVPHALNPQLFYAGEDGRRRIDIGVRSFRYPPYIGDNDRNRLLDFFQAHFSDMHIDISTEQRLGRHQWAGFLRRCLGTVSTEAGSFWLQKDDSIVKAIQRWLEAERKGLVIASESRLRRVAHLLPWEIKQWLARFLSRYLHVHYEGLDQRIDAEMVIRKFFADTPKTEVYGKCISSRHFDAIGAGSCQIMIEGRFNDILSPGEHYIPLKRDFSNIDEAMRQFLDRDYRLQIVRNARECVLAGHTYAHRIETIRNLIS